MSCGQTLCNSFVTLPATAPDNSMSLCHLHNLFPHPRDSEGSVAIPSFILTPGICF